MFVIALPAKKEGKLNAPSPPVKSEKVYELTKDQELDIEVPAIRARGNDGSHDSDAKAPTVARRRVGRRWSWVAVTRVLGCPA